jgi:hypothetical protein
VGRVAVRHNGRETNEERASGKETGEREKAKGRPGPEREKESGRRRNGRE